MKRYKLLAEKARDIILFVQPEGKIVEANQAACQAYGYSQEELLNMTIFQLRATNAREFIKEQVDKAMQSGLLFETIHRRKDGSLFPVEVSSVGAVLDHETLILSIIRDISERKLLEARVQHLLKHDYLTGLANRSFMEQFLHDLKNKHEIDGALLFLDLDNFKMINDSYGYNAGDAFLIHTVEIFKRSLKKLDFLARIGGDEFALFLPGRNRKEAKQFADKLLKDLENETFHMDGQHAPFRVTVSIGIVLIDEAMDMKHIFSYAEEALRLAKKEGKNRIVLIQEREEKSKILSNNRMLALIHEALNQDRFELVLQPVYKIGYGLIHYEALVRMKTVEGDTIPPGLFIPLAERYGLISAIDHWMIDQTIQVLRVRKDLKIFVNLSGGSLVDEELLEWLEFSIMHCEIEPARLGFEITESTAIMDLAMAEEWISRLKKLGCLFALDDFGVGFSSFSHLQQLPVDYLKIDGSFVRDLDSNPTQRALIQAMNAVAHALGKETIAEFVENEAIWSILHELKVDCGQGYFLSKPMPWQCV